MTHKCHTSLDTAIYIKSGRRKIILETSKSSKSQTPLQDLTEDEIEEMMREADLDGDGKVLFYHIDFYWG